MLCLAAFAVAAASCASNRTSQPSPTTVPAAAVTTMSSVAHTADATDPGGMLAALQARPLKLPQISTPGNCPITTVVSSPSKDLGPLIGDGPARPGGFNPVDGLQLAPASRFSSDSWAGNKVLWALSSARPGPVLVRGHQLDGDHEVRFGNAPTPVSTFVMNPAAATPLDGGWYDFPGNTRLEQAGCYAYQIDSPEETSTVVFKAVGP